MGRPSFLRTAGTAAPGSQVGGGGPAKGAGIVPRPGVGIARTAAAPSLIGIIPPREPAPGRPASIVWPRTRSVHLGGGGMGSLPNAAYLDGLPRLLPFREVPKRYRPMAKRPPRSTLNTQPSPTTRAGKTQSGFYETPGAALFVPTEDMWLVHEASKPTAILRRAGLSPHLWRDGWFNGKNNRPSWLAAWLYGEAIPAEELTHFKPSPGMVAFRQEATVSAIARASQRAPDGPASTNARRCMGHVSNRMVSVWLKKYERLAWFLPWFLRGENPPLSASGLRRWGESATAWPRGTIRGVQGGGPGRPRNLRAMAGRGLNTRSRLAEMAVRGLAPPLNAFVVSEELLETPRRAPTDAAICSAIGVSRPAPIHWRKNPRLRESFEAICKAVAKGGSIEGTGPWDDPSSDEELHGCCAPAATLSACVGRSFRHPSNFYGILRTAEKKGMRETLERYLDPSQLPSTRRGVGWRQCGIVSPNLFVPTKAMRLFRKAALDAGASISTCIKDLDASPASTFGFSIGLPRISGRARESWCLLNHRHGWGVLWSLPSLWPKLGGRPVRRILPWKPEH